MVRGIQLFFLSFLVSLSVFAQVPSTEEIRSAATDVRSSLDQFERDQTQENIHELKEQLLDYMALIADAETAVSKEKGGAATEKTTKAVRELGEQGVAIAEQLFVVRTRQGDSLARNGLEQSFEDLMANQVQYPLLKMAFAIMRTGVDEKSNVDGRVSTVDVLRRSIKEVGRDIAYLFRFGRNRSTGELWWGPRQDFNREKLTQGMIPMYQQLSASQIPEFNNLYDGDHNYDRENHEERLAGLLLWLTDRAVNIRAERNSAQKYATFTYAIAGMVLTALPINFLGNSYTAHLESAILIAGAFSVITAGKFLISSVKSTAQWVELSNFIRGNMEPGLIRSTELYLRRVEPREYHPAQVPKWIARRMAIRKVIAEKLAPMTSLCSSLLANFRKKSED